MVRKLCGCMRFAPAGCAASGGIRPRNLYTHELVFMFCAGNSAASMPLLRFIPRGWSRVASHGIARCMEFEAGRFFRFPFLLSLAQCPFSCLLSELGEVTGSVTAGPGRDKVKPADVLLHFDPQSTCRM